MKLRGHIIQKIQTNLDKILMNLDEIQAKFRPNLEKKFRQNFDKIQNSFKIDTHFRQIEKKSQTNLEEIRTHYSLNKFRQNLDKFRTPRFTASDG